MSWEHLRERKIYEIFSRRVVFSSNLLVIIINCPGIGPGYEESWLCGHLKLSFSFFAEIIQRLTLAIILLVCCCFVCLIFENWIIPLYRWHFIKCLTHSGHFISVYQINEFLAPYNICVYCWFFLHIYFWGYVSYYS